MAEKPAVWGIDIGQSAIKALKLRYQEQAGQVMAVAFDYVSYPKLLSQPDAVPEEIVPQAMATFLSRNQLKGDLLAMPLWYPTHPTTSDRRQRKGCANPPT